MVDNSEVGYIVMLVTKRTLVTFFGILMTYKSVTNILIFENVMLVTDL